MFTSWHVLNNLQCLYKAVKIKHSNVKSFCGWSTDLLKWHFRGCLSSCHLDSPNRSHSFHCNSCLSHSSTKNNKTSILSNKVSSRWRQTPLSSLNMFRCVFCLNAVRQKMSHLAKKRKEGGVGVLLVGTLKTEGQIVSHSQPDIPTNLTELQENRRD